MQEPPAPRYPSRLSVVVVLFLITGPLYVIAGAMGNFALGKWPVLIGELILPLPAYLYLRLYGFNVRSIFRLNPVSWRLAAVGAVLGLALHLLVYELDRLLNMLWEAVWPFPEYLQSELEVILLARSWDEWIVVILASVIIAGIFEEMLFRGFVQITFEQYHTVAIAIAITASIFAATHGLLWWFVQIFVLGAFLGWMAWKSESIIPGVIVHAMNNLFAVLFVNFKTEPEWLFWHSAAPVLGEGHVHPLYLLTAIAVCYYGFRLFNRLCEEEMQIPTLFNTPA